MAKLTDEQLFAQYRRGDLESFRTLIERHQEDLMRFLTRLLGNRQAAEDVFQETFLQIHHSGDTFDIERRFRPWLFTIAANKGRDYLRKRSRRRELDLHAPIKGGGSAPGGDDNGSLFVDLMEIDIDAPDARLDRSEREARVQQAIDGMSPTLREILLLAYFQRLSYIQIAEDLGIPLGTVKSRLHAAVASFAKRWQQVTREDSPRNGSEKPGPQNPAEPAPGEQR